MKKRFLPLSMLLITMVLAQASLVANAAGIQGKYTPRTSTEATFSSFMKSIRANQETGLIDPALLIAAQKADQSTTKDGELNWFETGPDNFGGLTRAIVYDKNGNVVIGTMGGDIFRTTNGGITFKRITNLNLPISSMVINNNGDIFVGTGDGREAHLYNGLSYVGYETSFVGNGVYKMASGSTELVLLESTSNWAFVNEMAINGSKIYAATNDGLMRSTDNGETWTKVLDGIIRSVKVNNNGDVLAATDVDVYLSKDGGEYTNVTANLPANSYEKVIAMSPSDANYMYIAYLNYSNSYSTGNIYFTNDGGENWDIAVAATTMYTIFGDDANYNGFIAVYPNNPRKLLIGSENLWLVEDETGSGVNSYRPMMISESNCSEYTAIAYNRYIYLHRGIQNIVFDPSNENSFYVGTVGGVYKGEFSAGLYSYSNSNRYYLTDDNHTSVTRMMSVGVGGTSKVIGGCLDHGTIKVERDEDMNNITTGKAVFPNPTATNNAFGYYTKDYAGGPCTVSTIDPDIIFVTVTGALTPAIHRSETDGEDYDLNNFYTDTLNKNSFRTPIALHEFYNDANNPYNDLQAPIRTVKHVGETVYAYSHQAGFPVDHVITEEPIHDAEHMDESGEYVWIPGDTIKNIHDPLSSIYLLAVKGRILMTRDALMFSKEAEWAKVSAIEGLATAVSISGDGNVAMVGTANGNLYRLTGLKDAYTVAQACTDSAACVITVDMVNNFNNQAVTSIAFDPKNNANVIVTLGNYGNSDYVFKSTNGGDSFTSANFGNFPVYSSIIEKETGLYIIGTEKGIYTSTNGSSWSKSGNFSAPVMDIKQAVVENRDDKVDVLYDELGVPTYIIYPGVDNEGMIFAATYGNGIIACDTYKVGSDFGVDENEYSDSNVALNVYPNPVKDMVNVNITLDTRANVSYQIYDLSGRMVMSNTLGFYGQGEHTLNISAENLESGSYIIRVKAGDKENSGKFLVY